MKLSSKIAFAALAVSISSLASAQSYVGGSLGQSNTFFNGEFNSTTAGESNSKDKTKTAYKLFGGYNINKYFAVEGGYMDLGSPTAKTDWVGGFARSKQNETAWFAAAKGTLPINEKFNFFGKLGMSANRVESTVTGLGVVNRSASKTRGSLLYGIGAEYNVTKQIGLRFEFENLGRFGNAITNDGNGDPQSGTGRTDTIMWSLGAAYKF